VLDSDHWWPLEQPRQAADELKRFWRQVDHA
jgi:hypothetical protein